MSSSPELPEPPECPVCLQIFDGACAIPRVLPCGHSACESCLTHLPNPFPQIIRCPCCTQLVKFSSISSLPKNIDLLRLSNLLIPQNPHHVTAKPTKKIDLFGGDQEFGPILWTPMFYIEWKGWILGRDCVLVDKNDASCGRMGLVGVHTRCLWKEYQEVRLVKVGFYREKIGDKFVYSYVGRIMRVLWGMRDGEKEELGLVMRGSGVYGLWCNEEDGGVFLVCESYGGGGLENLGYLEHGCVGIEEEDVESSKNGNMLALLMVGMEMCEAVMRLHLGGLSFGCLGLSCFGFDEFGHGFVEISEVLIMGMRVRKMFGDVVLCKGMNDCRELGGSLKNYLLDSFVFASPELFFELSMKKKGRDLGLGKEGYEIGCGSDVWSLGCVLILFLVGKPFMEEMHDYLCCFVTSLSDEEEFDCEELYMGWMQKVNTLLETRLGLEFLSVKETLLRCFDFDPGSRPVVADVWKCIRGMIIKPKFDMVVSLRPEVTKKKLTHALVRGELCQLLMEINEGLEEQKIGATELNDENGKLYVDHVEKLSVDRDVKGGLSRGHVKCIDLKGHLDCITGLAVGGGFLFSSSFDKTVQIWSLEDFTHIHSFKGHEHKVMAVAFADEEQPLCISGDSGGGICIWGVRIPFGEEPIQKLYEEKDWRYSGIHALAISGTGYFYTGSGDRSIKAWSIQNYTLSCTLTGHKSVVSTLAVCNGVLYSGSWDGTVRLWCLSDHSSLTVLGEDSPGNVTSVLSLAADQRLLISAHESGHLKIWSDNILLKSTEDQDGAVLSVSTDGKMIFAGGWSKTVTVQELVGDDSSKDVIQIGSIHCSSVITALLYWQGILFVGQADRGIKVYHYGV